MVRTILSQTSLPERFCHYAVGHVTECRNHVHRSITKTVPHITVFGTLSSELTHIRPVVYLPLYCPTLEQLSIFKARVCNGLNLHHERGGSFRIASADSTIRAKHVRFEEYKLPGIPLIHTAYHEKESDSVDTENVSINLSDSKIPTRMMSLENRMQLLTES